jgi:hypothetical protein
MFPRIIYIPLSGGDIGLPHFSLPPQFGSGLIL